MPVATVIGRYYAMDRDKRWDRVSKAYEAIVEAQGSRFPDAQAAISDAYAHNLTDEFIVPSVIGNYAGVKNGDGVLCFNFRADRVREILGALLDQVVRWVSAQARDPLCRCGRNDAVQR